MCQDCGIKGYRLRRNRPHQALMRAIKLTEWGQVPDEAPVLGELAFFIGIPQPATIRAR